MSRKYWNEELETLTPAALERLEHERLGEQVRYMCATSPFYAARLREAGVDPAHVRHRDDLARVPFTEKAALAESQRAGALIGANQCAPRERIVRVQATGGTTGQPMRIAFTARDVADYNQMGARAVWTAGCRPGDIVFECFNYNLYAGGVSDHMSFEALGAAVVPFGVGNSERLLGMMAHLADELCLYATPSYAVRLIDVSHRLDMDLRTLGVRKGFLSGESGLQVPGYRARIEDAWGLEAHDIYGTGELGMQSAECEHRAGFHYGGTGYVLAELVDPASGEPLVPADGVTGEFVYTSLRREASPLLRMRSHDAVQVYTEPCPCGRTGLRFRVLGRTDDMFIVKGVNVFPGAVQAAIASLAPRVTGEFRILLEQAPPIDYAPRVVVEVAREVPAPAHAGLIAELARVIARQVNFTAAVELVPQGSIASERKTRRLYRAWMGETPPDTPA